MTQSEIETICMVFKECARPHEENIIPSAEGQRRRIAYALWNVLDLGDKTKFLRNCGIGEHNV